MLLVQPPVKRMDVIKKEGWQTGCSEVEGKLLAHRGLKMGVLYDFVEEEAHSGSNFHSTALIANGISLRLLAWNPSLLRLVPAAMSRLPRGRRGTESLCI